MILKFIRWFKEFAKPVKVSYQYDILLVKLLDLNPAILTDYSFNNVKAYVNVTEYNLSDYVKKLNILTKCAKDKKPFPMFMFNKPMQEISLSDFTVDSEGYYIEPSVLTEFKSKAYLLINVHKEIENDLEDYLQERNKRYLESVIFEIESIVIAFENAVGDSRHVTRIQKRREDRSRK